MTRWRFDAMIAATGLVAALPLIHKNPADYEAIRGAIERAPERFPKLEPLGADPVRLTGRKLRAYFSSKIVIPKR